MVLAVTSITTFILNTTNAVQLLESIQRYFFCEQGGHNPSNPCSSSDIVRNSYPWITCLSNFLLAMLPVVNLVYAVRIQELQTLWMKWFKKKKDVITDNPSTATSLTH